MKLNLRFMPRVCILFPLIAMGYLVYAGDPPAAPPSTAAKIVKTGMASLLDVDRLQIREAQLGLAQAHIARLQAENEVKDHQMAVQALEKKIANLIAELSKQYGCAECQLQNDFTWKKPAPSEPVSTPAPNGGQSETKE